MALISISEIEQMSRDAYERGKREGAAEERERCLQAALDTLYEHDNKSRDALDLEIALRKAICGGSDG
jgi:hypothetical protein